jgi:hypothetical protein
MKVITKQFTLEVRFIETSNARIKQARAETQWNRGCIDWCDWQPYDIALSNMLEDLSSDGLSPAEIESLMYCHVRGVKFGQMK